MKLGSMTIQIIMIFVIKTKTSCEIKYDDVQKEVEVRSVTPFRKKGHQQLMQNPQLHQQLKEFHCHCCLCRHVHSIYGFK